LTLRAPFNDVLSDDQEDPSTQAAWKMNWESFCDGLPERERVAVLFVAEGKTLREAARSLGVSDSAMQGSKRSLGVKILEFMGNRKTQEHYLPGRPFPRVAEAD